MHIYTETSKILKLIKEKRGSLKTLVFSSRFHNKRKLFALVCEALKFSQVLNIIFDRAKLPQRLNNYPEKQYLLMVLAYEHFVGQGLEKSKAIAKHFFRNINVIEKEHRKLLVERDVTCLADLIPKQEVITLPRYVRVNLLKSSVEKVVTQFRREGWVLRQTSKSSFISDAESLGHREFLQDPHLSDVLVFTPGKEFHKHKMCVDGEVILQDKASCFPAHVLSPPEGSVVVDCCAAPGNKTSHVASLMHNTGKIFAFDKDSKRVKTLKSMLNIAGVTNTEVTCMDFLKVNPQEEMYRDVEYIVVDPSCSGSGIVGRLNHVPEDENNESRLKGLSNFQATVLKHALSFPNVKRVVYSTCSIHAQENESVISEVIEKVSPDFKLTQVFPDWTNRGVKGYPQAQKCLRMTPEDNLTHGFFVACFERKRNFKEKHHVESSKQNRPLEEKVKDSKASRKLKNSKKKRNNSVNVLEKGESNGVSDRKLEKKKIDHVEGCLPQNMKYRVTKMADIVRVDNSSSFSGKMKVFKRGNSVRERLLSNKISMRMFQKTKVDFEIKKNKSCCIVECTPSKLRNSSRSSVSDSSISSKTVQDRVKTHLSKAQKRKLKKKRKKQKHVDVFVNE